MQVRLAGWVQDNVAGSTWWEGRGEWELVAGQVWLQLKCGSLRK
jgi:hypothetical protein